MIVNGLIDIKVFLAGTDVTSDCISVDTLTDDGYGYVEMYDRDHEGNLIVTDDGLNVVRLWGKVRVIAGIAEQEDEDGKIQAESV